jgi:hypothetical protein
VAKKNKTGATDGQQLLRRLRAAEAQLRDQATRARGAADSIARMLRQLEAGIDSADGRTASHAVAGRETTRRPRASHPHAGS